MNYKGVLLFFLLICCVVFSQNSITLKGLVLSDSIGVKNVHVFNKSSLEGVVTNNDGLFRIKVSKMDSLLITAVSFQDVLLKIDSVTFKSQKISVYLKQKILDLDEVVVNSHNLSGSLLLDLHRVPDDFKSVKTKPVTIDVEDINPYTLNDFKSIDDRKLADPIGDPMSVTNVDIAQILIGLTKGIRTKIKLKKAAKKINKQIPSLIIEDVGVIFFTRDLKIPLEEIDRFMNYCTNDTLNSLYRTSKQIELLDYLINKSKEFMKIK